MPSFLRRVSRRPQPLIRPALSLYSTRLRTSKSHQMETELHIALQLCNPQAMHDKNDGPFVRYDSHLNGDRKSLALGVNISGNKENIKSGGWAFVHALVKPGTQGADVDLDVVSLRKISKSDGPGIAITEGTSDYKCVGGEGKWILMRVGADKKSSWTVA